MFVKYVSDGNVVDGVLYQPAGAGRPGERRCLRQTKDVLNRSQAEMDLLSHRADEAGLPLRYRN
jgi:hypothetical protein